MPVRQALEVPGRYGFHSTRSGHPARGVRLVMSDAHEGMKATVANVLKSSFSAAVTTSCAMHRRMPQDRTARRLRLPCKTVCPRRCRGCQDAVTQGRRSVPPQAAEACAFSRQRRSTYSPTRPPAAAPDQAALHQSDVRLIGAILLEQNEEWRSTVPVMTMETVAPLRDDSSVSLTALAS